jgi:hypothetical protein
MNGIGSVAEVVVGYELYFSWAYFTTYSLSVLSMKRHGRQRIWIDGLQNQFDPCTE